MERTKRKNVFRAELIIFLAVIAVSLLVLWIRWENSHATYKNYDIVVKKNVYCEKTQTGRVDLQIRRKGGKKAKLLQTQQELKQSQSFQIVEDSYKLGIVDDASAYDGNIYEQKNAGGIQYLTLYYVNHEASGRQGKMHLVMNDAKTGKELINIKTSPKVKKDARRYEYRGKDLYVSEEGILLDAGTDEEFYNSQAMTAGLMTVCWKNGKEKQIQFDPNADVSEYEAADIIIPKVTSTGEEKSEENRCYYALELSDWENIREIKLGENVFAKAENLEKATDDLNKKKKKSKEEKAKEEAEKKPLLGICLGMQLLFEKSYEYGEHEGLGFVKGEVCPLEPDLADKTLKVPQIGWNALHIVKDDPLFKYIREGEYVYYVHSYYGKNCTESTLAVSDYSIPVTGAVRAGRVYGTQFHPEKSGDTGLRILKAFAEL